MRSQLILRTFPSTHLLFIINNMANKSVLIAMIASFAMASNINAYGPQDFLRFARLPAVNVRAFDNITRGWNKTKWDEFASYKKVKVCEDEDTICESETRWGQMTERLEKTR